MKILSIGNDNNLFNVNSKVSQRIIEYGNLVDKYVVFAPRKTYCKVKLSEKVFAYGSGGSNKIFRLLNIYKTVKELLKQERFDVITIQDQYYLALVGLFLARKFKVGLELQIHGFEKYSGLRKIIAKFVIPRANAIRCVSQRLKIKLVSEFGVKKERITVVPIYIENKKDNIKNRNFDKKQGDKIIFLTVGRLVPVKNIDLQIKAMVEVVKKNPNTELWIVGDGPEMANCKRKIANRKLENNIKLLGWQNNLEEFYTKADVFLLTSNYEGWGMVVVEASGYDLPIIMTDVGCAGELIENEKSGLVIPTNNQFKLEEAMTRLINDDNLRKKLAENALFAVKNLPNKEETLSLYKKSWSKALLVRIDE